ncbi:MAG: hypothetical protein Q9175_005758 [Cornicularia normoerica]
MLGDLKKVFSNEKKPDLPAMPYKDPVDVPVSAVRITRYGLVYDLQLTWYRKTDEKFLIGDKYYYVPRCMQAHGTTELDPTIRRLNWEFKKEYASNSTAAKQEAFKGIYSIWFKDLRTSPDPKFLSQIDGEFWMMKQLQHELERSNTIEWAELHKDMVNELNKDWWFMGVLLPDIDTVSREEAERRRALRDVPKSLNEGELNQ